MTLYAFPNGIAIIKLLAPILSSQVSDAVRAFARPEAAPHSGRTASEEATSCLLVPTGNAALPPRWE